MTLSSDKKSWEDICARCGLCCFEKIEDERGNIFFTRTPCRYLDIVTRECRVYERRFAVNPECVKLTPELVGTLRWLHDGCAYRQALMSESALQRRGKTAATAATRRRKIPVK